MPRERPIGKRRPAAPFGGGLAGLLARIAAFVVLAWAAGFLWFSLTLPDPAPLTTRTDAVVVLTGGAGRLARGLEVIEAGSAQRMLISGVGHAITRKQLAAAAGIQHHRLDRADLGYEAVDTRSNAEETARWVAQHGYKSLRLVTSAAHMRRARLELAAVLPASVAVIPDAVPVDPEAPGIATEYSKYLLRFVALQLGAA